MSTPQQAEPVSVYSGDDLLMQFNLQDINGNPVDVRTYEFTAQWRPSPDSTNPTPFDIDTTEAATGTIVLSMTGAQTAAMAGDGVYDLQAVSGGVTFTLLYGVTKYQPDVTRA